MKRTLWIGAVAAFVCALAADSGVVNAGLADNSDKTQKRVAVKALASARTPAGITSAVATRADNGAVLSYSVANRGGERLTSLEVVAFAIDAHGAIMGGEGWTVNVDLAKNATAAFSAILENNLSPEGRLVVAVRKASGPSGTFEVENSELVNLVKSSAGVAAAVAPVFMKARYGGAVRQQTYCQSALNMASNTCSCGVASFTCNDANQSFSFSCNRPPEGQAECAAGGGESE